MPEAGAGAGHVHDVPRARPVAAGEVVRRDLALDRERLVLPDEVAELVDLLGPKYRLDAFRAVVEVDHRLNRHPWDECPDASPPSM